MAASPQQDPQEEVRLIPDARKRRILLSSAKRKALGLSKFGGRSTSTDVVPPGGGPGTDTLSDVVVELEPVAQGPPKEASPSAAASEGVGQRCVCLVS